jgi:hypothetical protein
MQLFVDASQLSVQQAILPQTVTTTTTFASVDTANNGQCLNNLIVNTGTVSGSTPQIVLQVYESADNSTFTAISGAAVTVTASGLAYLEFLASHRYLQIVGTVTGGGPSFAISAISIAQAKSSASATGYSNLPSQAFGS